jgi:hypothetical protein
MGKIGKDYKYTIVKNFLTKEEINLSRKYFIIKQRLNFDNFDETQMKSSTCDSKWYADPLTESFLLNKINKMEEITGLKLLPTYSFSRVYTYCATLDKHIDRPSCQISATVMVGSSGEEWPIYMDGNKLNLEPGDAAIYMGMDVKHWREEFKGDWHSQFFLHYVDADGPYKNYYLDKRPLVGAQK